MPPVYGNVKYDIQQAKLIWQCRIRHIWHGTHIWQRQTQHIGAKTRKCWNRIPRNPFCRLLEPRPGNAEIGPPGSPGAKARKCLNRAPGTHFVDFWSQSREMQIKPPGTHFADIWSQGQKMLKSELLMPILSTSGGKARICLNRTSWGNHFVDFWNQGQKMLKSNRGTHFVDVWS